MLRELKGSEDFNDLTEVLRMLKPGYGLKHAPRLRFKALIKAPGPIQLLDMHNSGAHLVECNIFLFFIDARAVFDSVPAKTVKTPADNILLLHALAL